MMFGNSRFTWCVLAAFSLLLASTTQLSAQGERRGGFQRGGQEGPPRGGQESGEQRGERGEQRGEQRGGFRGEGGRGEAQAENPRGGRSGRGDGGPGVADNRGGDNRGGDNRGDDNRPTGRGGEGRGGEGRGGEGRGGEGRGGEGRGGEGRGGEGRGGEGRGGEATGGEERRGPATNRRRGGGAAAGTLRDQVINQLVALDLNKDGRLDPGAGEGNLLSATILARVGLDPGLPVHVETLRGLVNQIDLETVPLDVEVGIRAENAPSSFEFPRVPRPRTASSDFTVHPLLADPKPLNERYSPLIVEEVRSLIARFDENRNGVLDADEIINVPWGPPSPLESDLDQNGQLNEVELAERLNTLSSSETRGRRPRNRGEGAASNPEADAARAQREAEREAAAAERRERERERRNSSTDRVSTYVKDLITRFDKDGDGLMSLEEAAEMRNPPPKTADTDKDGKLSAAELYAYYSDGQSPSTSTSSGRSGNNQQTSSDRGPMAGNILWDGELERKSESTDKQWPASLEGKDRNQDGMISLAEFAADPDENQRAAFSRWDANRDGFITRAEAANGDRAGGPASSGRATSERSGPTSSSTGRRQSGQSSQSGQAANRSGRGSSTPVPNQRDAERPGDTGAPKSGEGASQAPPNSVRYNIFDK